MKISAVLVTSNEKETIEKKLTNLLMQTRVLDEIVVVDNHSTDHTMERAEKILHKTKIPFRMIRVNEAVSENECFRIGSGLARGELILRTNKNWRIDHVEKIAALEKPLVIEGKIIQYLGLELLEKKYTEESIIAISKDTKLEDPEKMIITAKLEGKLGIVEGTDLRQEVADQDARYEELLKVFNELRCNGIHVKECDEQLSYYANTKSASSSFKTKFQSLKNGDYKKYAKGMKSFFSDLH